MADDNLFILIKSLSRNEKSYFKKYATAFNNKESNYIKLYDIISNLKEYNQDIVIAKLGDNKFSRNISNSKNYLFALILKSLHNFYHANNKSSRELASAYISSSILSEKQLPKLAYAIINRALKKTKSTNSTDSNLGLKIALQLSKIDLSAKITGNIDFKALDKLNQTICFLQKKEQLFTLDLKAHDLVSTAGRIYNKNSILKIKKIVSQASMLKNSNETDTSEHTFLYHSIMYRYNLYLCDFESCLVHSKKMVECASTYNNTWKISSYSLLLDASSRISSDIDYFNILSELKNIPANSISVANKTLIKTQQTFLHAVLLLQRNCFKRQFKKAIIDITSISDKDMSMMFSSRDFEALLYLRYFISYAYFGLGEYEKALESLEYILERNKLYNKHFFFIYAKILQLYCHFELKNESLVISQLNSIKRAFHQNNILLQCEELAINLIKKLINRNINNKQLDIFKEFETLINKIKNKPREKNCLNYFALDAWINSKIENRPFNKIVAERKI